MYENRVDGSGPKISGVVQNGQTRQFCVVNFTITFKMADHVRGGATYVNLLYRKVKAFERSCLRESC